MKSLRYYLLSLLGAITIMGCTKEVEPSYAGKYVDLGLSVKWAQVNLGATKREDSGDYFAWGETAPKDEYSEENYTWYNEEGMLTKYCTDPDYGIVDGKSVLEPEDDAATVILGAGWRTPTFDEVQELLENCTWVWSSLGGVRGYRVTSNVPGYTDNYIFLPAGGLRVYDEPPVTNYQGLFWSSTKYAERCTTSHYMHLRITIATAYRDSRWLGLNIRPVYDK